MCKRNGLLLTGLLSLLVVSPVMAKDHFSFSMNFGKSCSYVEPVVVHRPVVVARPVVRVAPAPVVVTRHQVVVEKRCPTVVVVKPRPRVVYVAPVRHWDDRVVVRPHVTTVVVRKGHCH